MLDKLVQVRNSRQEGLLNDVYPTRNNLRLLPKFGVSFRNILCNIGLQKIDYAT